MVTIEQLAHETFYRMGKYSQYVIDQVEDIEDDIGEMTADEIGAKIYQLNLVYEIIQTERLGDIEAITALIDILEKRLTEVQDRHLSEK